MVQVFASAFPKSISVHDRHDAGERASNPAQIVLSSVNQPCRDALPNVIQAAARFDEKLDDLIRVFPPHQDTQRAFSEVRALEKLGDAKSEFSCLVEDFFPLLIRKTNVRLVLLGLIHMSSNLCSR